MIHRSNQISVTNETRQRIAHQLRQRERGKHPQRNRAAGHGVEEICLMRICKADGIDKVFPHQQD
jgi:hypothetical protein